MTLSSIDVYLLAEEDLLEEAGRESLIRKVRGGLKADALVMVEEEEREEVKSLVDGMLSLPAAHNIPTLVFIRLKGE